MTIDITAEKAEFLRSAHKNQFHDQLKDSFQLKRSRSRNRHCWAHSSKDSKKGTVLRYETNIDRAINGCRHHGMTHSINNDAIIVKDVNSN